MTEAPLATYRLQLVPESPDGAGPGAVAGFDLNAAADLVDYLGELGISHVYLSPILTARKGSTHGYDVADPGEVSPALGGERALRKLADKAHARGMGLVVDIVPNHVGADAANPLWEELLAGGRSGPAGSTFDVDWDPPLPGAANKVILPVLGNPYGVVLHAGDLQLVEEEDGGIRVRYYDHSFPVSSHAGEAVHRTGGVAAFRGTPGAPESWVRLHALLEQQHYRLVHWRVGHRLINYRRFFTIDELAAVRVEDEAVFERIHGCILELVREGVVDGLRIDHPDGLRDPGRYFDRLADRTGGTWTVAEKILHPGEHLPDWPVAGTTGYEFCNDVLGLFVNPDAREKLDRLNAEFGAVLDYSALAVQGKREVLAGGLGAELRRLARSLLRLAQQDLTVRDVDEFLCAEVLGGIICGLHVYRTYVDPQTGHARNEDVDRIEAAVSEAKGRLEVPDALVTFVADVLTGRSGSTPEHLEVIARFQQLSGAAMAKGTEDTAFYRYRRLVAVNEVGGDPDRLGIDAATFHAGNAERARRYPTAMLTTATHDTKRGEDVRLRIAALTEMLPAWGEAVRRWRTLNADAVTQTRSGPAPNPQSEYVIYQTLVGVWPLGGVDGLDATVRRRVEEYVIKASREAGQRTTWEDPAERFEEGVERFVEQILDPRRSPEFVRDMDHVATAAAEIAMVSGLAQTLLRCTCPGVPDTYQGMELWGDYLVDPDNRRPVDFGHRRQVLAGLEGADPAGLLKARRDGRIKAWVLSRALHTRAAHVRCVDESGSYRPLQVQGRWADHLVAFAREAPDGDALVVVAPRLPGAVMAGGDEPPLASAWGDTAVGLPAQLRGSWSDVLGRGHLEAGERLAVSEVLRVLPVALLARP